MITPETKQLEFNYYSIDLNGLDNWKEANSASVPLSGSNILTGANGSTVQTGDLRSGNFVKSSTGWQLTSEGNLEANDGDFRGTITATTGLIGKWNINATSIYTGTEDHSGYTANAGDLTIYSDGSDASIHAKNFYIDTTGTFYTTAGSLSGVTITAIPNDTSTDISLLDMTHNLVFSVTDKDTVAWATGTITLSNGRTFSISAGNTGNMSAKTYIYLDTAVSLIVLQTTTTTATAMGANKKLVAVAQNGSAEATFQVNEGIGGLKLTAAMTSISNNDWAFSGTWSVTDADTVAWGSGTLTTSNGGSYSITGANTGNMSAKNYIYFDLGVSATAFQLTTTAATAIGDGKILIAIAQNGTSEANYIVMNDKAHNIDAANIVAGSITANEIAASTITADRMSVTTLSAITADLGTITAGTVTGATVRTAASGSRFSMNGTSFQGIASDNDVVFEVVVDGVNEGDVIMGDDTGSAYAKWDNSAGTFTIYGSNLNADTQTFTSSGTWTKPSGLSGTELVIVQAWGGGGAGGAGIYSDNSAGGGGGGGGCFVERKFKASELGATETVTIGAAGTGGAGAGGVGGNTTFGTLLTAYGGGGGGKGTGSAVTNGRGGGGGGGGIAAVGSVGADGTAAVGAGGTGGAMVGGAAGVSSNFGGAGGATALSVSAGESVYGGGGGGGGGCTDQLPGRSYYGGGGGGGGHSGGGTMTGGVAIIYGGNGGNGRTTPTAGTAPGGGGGGAYSTSGTVNGASGAKGQVIVWTFK